MFSGKAIQRITDSPLQHVVVTNTIPQTEQGAACSKVRVKSVGRLLGEAIKRIHHGDSISSLFVPGPLIAYSIAYEAVSGDGNSSFASIPASFPPALSDPNARSS